MTEKLTEKTQVQIDTLTLNPMLMVETYTMNSIPMHVVQCHGGGKSPPSWY